MSSFASTFSGMISRPLFSLVSDEITVFVAFESKSVDSPGGMYNEGPSRIKVSYRFKVYTIYSPFIIQTNLKSNIFKFDIHLPILRRN